MLMHNKVHMTFRGMKSTNMDDKKYQGMEVVAFSIIWMCLADTMNYDMVNEKTTHGLGLKLESLFMSNNVTNKLFMKCDLY